MKYKRGIVPTLLAVALVATGIWGYTQYQAKNDYKINMGNQYQRLFFDMKDNIETVQTSISKALVSNSREKNILLLTQIWQQAYFAKDKLSQLPIQHKDLSKTEKFLNQVADYSYALIQEHLDGKELSDKQRQSLFKLQDYTASLTQELSEIHNKVLKGDIDPDVLGRRGREELEEQNEDMLNAGLSRYEEDQLTEYPELIYDGPFSDQTMNIKPKGLGKGKVDEAKAKEIATEFIGDKKIRKVTTFEQGPNVKGAKINAYTFSMAPENEDKETGIYIGVSKIGGNVVWMENPRPVKDKKLSIKEAENHAQKFLQEKGFDSMETNYSLKYDGSVLFNFAYKQDDVTIYTDLIKVKVALDNGEIIAFDAANYLKSHHDRDIPEPKITQQEARDKVRYDFDVSNARLAIIPDRGKNDVLCYEFRGTYKGYDFIVYINAENGREEKILKIIKDDDGTLMI